MAETYLGHIRNGKVEFEGEPPSLPDGTRFRVEAEPPLLRPSSIPDDPMASTPAWLIAAAREVEADPEARTLPTDLAEQHDHYAHGKPRS
jgi:hypothetical protein